MCVCIIRCPLYAKLYLRGNATQFSSDSIERQTVWGNSYTCEFAAFAYLSAFVLSFVSLWLHVVFRRVLHTERLLRLPIGLLTFIFAVITFAATVVVIDGVIKFCLYSEPNICTASTPVIFRQSRWKMISLPVGRNQHADRIQEEIDVACTFLGGGITSIAILLNSIARIVQLLSKPKKSPESLKLLLGQLMTHRQEEKDEKDSSDQGSQTPQASPMMTERSSVGACAEDLPRPRCFPF